MVLLGNSDRRALLPPTAGTGSMRGSSFLVGAPALAALALCDPAAAADISALPTKAAAAPKPIAFDWDGFYFGGHFGYATGTSDWSATQPGAAPLAGTLDLFNSYNAFNGTGSYLAGLQAGYNFTLPSNFVLGIEGDLSAPATPTGLTGHQTFSSAAAGVADYSDTVRETGTVRGRFGHTWDNWLFYGTGGFAWSRDQLTRTQLAGMPLGGSATPGDAESQLLWRLGWAAGLGAEVALAPNWSAKVEYLATGFGRSSVTFPTGAQTVDSDLLLQSVRVGLDYHINSDA